MKLGKISCALVALVVAASAMAAAAMDNEKLIKYYRKKANVPVAQKVAVTNVKESAIKKLNQGTLEIGEGQGAQKVSFVASEDGRYVVFGALEDVTVDPMKAVMAKVNLTGFPSKGGKDAKVKIVEYTDFQCPFCSRGYTTMEQVLKEYGDKVQLYLKNYPLPFHNWAEPSAIAVECAKQQKPEAYWTLYSKLFEAQKEVTQANVKEKVTAMLADSGIDMAKFNECYDGKKTLADVNAQKAEGLALGIQGTPGFIINGRLISGAQPFEAFKTAIDAELAE